MKLILFIAILLLLIKNNEFFYNIDLNKKYNKKYSSIVSKSDKVEINKKYSNRDFNSDKIVYFEYPYKCLDYSDILDK